MSKTTDKIKFFDDASRNEKIAPPPYAQVGRAVRHGGSDIHFAYCKENAPATKNITCALDKTTGEEIEVYCEITPSTGTHLDDASPRLKTNDPIFVAKAMDSSGNNYWRCLTVFQGTKNTTCPYA